MEDDLLQHELKNDNYNVYWFTTGHEDIMSVIYALCEF